MNNLAYPTSIIGLAVYHKCSEDNIKKLLKYYDPSESGSESIILSVINNSYDIFKLLIKDKRIKTLDIPIIYNNKDIEDENVVENLFIFLIKLNKDEMLQQYISHEHVSQEILEYGIKYIINQYNDLYKCLTVLITYYNINNKEILTNSLKWIIILNHSNEYRFDDILIRLSNDSCSLK